MADHAQIEMFAPEPIEARVRAVKPEVTVALLGSRAMAAAPQVLITDQPQVADQMHEQTGHPVVVAENAHQLLLISRAVRESYPDKDLYVVTETLEPGPEGYYQCCRLASIKQETGAEIITGDLSPQALVQTLASGIGVTPQGAQPSVTGHPDGQTAEASEPLHPEWAAIADQMPERSHPDRLQVLGQVGEALVPDVLITSDPNSAQVAHAVAGYPVVVSPTPETLPDTVQAVQAAYPGKTLHLLGHHAPSHAAAAQAALEIEGTALIGLALTREEVAQGHQGIQDFYACRDHPEQAIRDTIEGGIEAAYEIRVQERGEPPAVEKDGTALIIVDHQPSAALIRDAFLDAAEPPALMLAAPDALETTLYAAQSMFPEKGIYLLAPVTREAEPNPYQEIAEQHGVGILSPTFSPEELGQGYKHFSDYKVSRDQVSQLVRHEIEYGIELAKTRQAEVAAEPPPAKAPQPEEKALVQTVGTRQQGEPILITRHEADARAIHEATGRAVLHANPAHDLKMVAEALREHEPDSPILICGENQHHLREQNGGRMEAEAAAQAVGGKAVVPVFTEQERKQAPPLTTFDDLAQSRGLEAVKRQIEAPLERLIQERQQEPEPQQERSPEQIAPARAMSLER